MVSEESPSYYSGIRFACVLHKQVYEITIANVQSGFLGFTLLSGENGRKFCLALSQSSEISYKLTGEKGTITEDIEGSKTTTLKKCIQNIASKLISSNAFDVANYADQKYISVPND